jgi:hypothetical protein
MNWWAIDGSQRRSLGVSWWKWDIRSTYPPILYLFLSRLLTQTDEATCTFDPGDVQEFDLLLEDTACKPPGTDCLVERSRTTSYKQSLRLRPVSGVRLAIRTSRATAVRASDAVWGAGITIAARTTKNASNSGAKRCGVATGIEHLQLDE